MLIKSVTTGREKGSPIEYSATEKFPLAVKRFISEESPEGVVRMFSKVEFESTDYSGNGTNEKGYANNSYLASGKVWYKSLDVAKDKLSPEKSQDFEIQFVDSLDEYGLPDIKLVSLNLH